MRDIEQLIDEALNAEERELLHSIGEEGGFFSQAVGIFGGPTGWVSIVMLVAQTLLFLAGAWAAWEFFEAVEPFQQLRWGLPAAVLLIVATVMKMALMPRMEANRVMRELKRVQLQIVRSSMR